MTANVDFELKPLLLPLTPAMLPPAKGEGPLIDQPAPDFTLEDLDGNPVRFSDFRGKPVVLNFWATWCGPCLAEIPHLDSLYNKYKDQDLVILGVNDEDHHNKVRAFAEEQISYPVLLDGTSQFQAYDVRGIPRTYYIDRKGVVRYQDVGFGHGKEKEIERKIEKLLQ